MSDKWRIYGPARVGAYPSFGAYLAFYETAVDRLLETVDSGKETPDSIALPVLALMRHSYELGYKFSLWELHGFIGERFDTKNYGHHDLAKLHAALCEYFEKVVVHLDLPESVQTSFKEKRPKTEMALRKFIELDRYSFSFRYPFDKATGEAHFDMGQTLDLLEIRRMFKEGMILLSFTPDVVGEYADLRASIEDWQGGW